MPTTNTPTALTFTFTCTHTTPPTPSPSPNSPILPTPTNHYPTLCLPCDASHRVSLQQLILDSYNGRIAEQAARLRVAAARKGTDSETRFDDEMVREGERRIREWRMKRAMEVEGVWRGFLGGWNGGERWKGEKTKMKLVLDGEGGYVVVGLLE